MKVSELLEEAKALIEDPIHWTKGTYARRVDGASTHYTQPDACTFCAEGALRHVVFTRKDRDDLPDSNYWKAEEILDREAMHMNSSVGCAITLNDRDDTTHATVMELYDRAILHAREQEAAQQ